MHNRTCTSLTLTLVGITGPAPQELQFDDEKVKEFFPLVGTIDRLLQVYSEMLGCPYPYPHSYPHSYPYPYPNSDHNSIQH